MWFHLSKAVVTGQTSLAAMRHIGCWGSTNSARPDKRRLSMGLDQGREIRTTPPAKAGLEGAKSPSRHDDPTDSEL